MGRSILAVIVGYVAMMVLVFGTFTVAYLLMGADSAFKPGLYEPSMLWLVVSFSLGAIAAVVSGLVCSLIARPGSKAIMALSIVVLALGMLGAVGVMMNTRPDPGPRTGDVPNLEAMMNAKQPVWVAVVNPLIGVAGVLIGARLRGNKPR